VIPLIVDLETEWRGGQSQAFLLLKGLYERGHAAELVAAHGSPLGHRAKKEGIYVHSVSRGRLRLAAAAKIRSVLADGRIELVHVNEAHALTAAWLALPKLHPPLVVSRRVGFPLRSGWLSQKRYRRADAILANSQWVAAQAAASGAPTERIRIVYEGVEVPALPSDAARAAARKRFRLEESDIVLGCVGALEREKGHEWVIRALADLGSEFPRCKLLIAGEGEYRRELTALAQELGCRERVNFAGFVKDIEAAYEAIDVFVFPSLFEGLGTSLLSAMSYAVPSITFFGCALGEIVENEVSGIQVEAKNPAAIADATRRILRQPECARKLGLAGRTRIAETFSAEKMVENTLVVYDELIGKS
jgi:glycosyltransferase involved in cell wall biosynthesis